MASTDSVAVPSVTAFEYVDGCVIIPNRLTIRIIEEITKEEAAALIAPYGWDLGPSSNFFYKAMAE